MSHSPLSQRHFSNIETINKITSTSCMNHSGQIWKHQSKQYAIWMWRKIAL